MRIKLIDYLFTLSNVLFILGIVISTILIINDVNKNPSSASYHLDFIYYLPFIIFLIMSFIACLTYLILKYKYFQLIKMHVSSKFILLNYISVSVLLLCWIFSALVFIFLYSFIEFSQIKMTLIILIVFSLILTLVDVGINSYSKIKIQIELAIRRTKGIEEVKNTEVVD